MPKSSLPDIQSFEDIQRFVDRFYERIQEDVVLGPIFDRIARVDWDSHLKLMYRFWDTVLFGTGNYKGNPLAAHLEVNQKVRSERKSGLSRDEFAHWLQLFNNTLDQLFSGPVTEHAKRGAGRMASHLATVCSEGYVEGPLRLVPEN